MTEENTTPERAYHWDTGVRLTRHPDELGLEEARDEVVRVANYCSFLFRQLRRAEQKLGQYVINEKGIL